MTPSEWSIISRFPDGPGHRLATGLQQVLKATKTIPALNLKKEWILRYAQNNIWMLWVTAIVWTQIGPNTGWRRPVRGDSALRRLRSTVRGNGRALPT